MLSLYIDEDSMSRGLIEALRRNDVDVLTTREAGRAGRPDWDQLTFATQEERVLFTANVADFCRLHAEWLVGEGHHAGIVVLTEQSMSIGRQLGRLLRLLSERTAAEMQDTLEFLANWG